MSKLTEFYEKFKIQPRENIRDKIQGKEKTATSILSKIKRNVEKDGWSDFTISDISDLSRCAVLFDSYDEISEYIMKLKQEIPQIDGYISRCSNGYRGIHLNFILDGIKTEIQLSTPIAWEYAQATEYIYSKWRDFDGAARQKEIHDLEKQQQSTSDMTEKKILQDKIDEKKKQLSQDYVDYDKEYAMCRDLFEELSSMSDFAKYETDIESVLLSLKRDVVRQPMLQSEPFIHKFETDENNKIDENEALMYAEECTKISKVVQDKLINCVESALARENVDEEFKNQYIEDQVIIANVITLYNKQLEQLVSNEVYLGHMRDFSIQKSTIAIEVAKYSREHDIESLTPEELIRAMISNYAQQHTNEDIAKLSMTKLLEKINNPVSHTQNVSNEILEK